MPFLMRSASTSWQLSVCLNVIIVATGLAYLRGRLQLRSISWAAIPAWRAYSFFLGLLSIWVAVASPVSSFDTKMLTAHMVQHLLLMTIAPPLIWLGAPMMPLSSALPIARRIFRLQPLRRIGGLFSHPAFCWLTAAAALVAWHVPALFRLAMQSETWHLLEHASFLSTGLLFWWPVIQPWPSVPKWPRWSMLVYLFLATLPCDVLSGLLVFSDRVAYPMYICMPQQSALDVIQDQQCAAALMWTCVTLVFLVAGTVLSTQLLSPGVAEESTGHHAR